MCNWLQHEQAVEIKENQQFLKKATRRETIKRYARSIVPTNEN